MKEINSLLKKYDIQPVKYLKKGHVLIVFTKDKKYVIKKSSKEVYDYLLNRHFDYFPKTIIENGYAISEYIEEAYIPKEQKILDLIKLVSLLHLKTTCYYKININDIKDIYESILDEINMLNSYYNNLMDYIETKVFMSPKEYTLARNISLFLNTLNDCSKKINDWYDNAKNMTNYRLVLLNNDLKFSNFKNNLLLNFSNAKFGLPIFDLYKLYKETYDSYDWYEIFKIYNKNYPLKKEEKELFLILLMLPNKISFQNIEYLDTIMITNEIIYLNDSLKLASKISKISPKDKEEGDKEK